MTTPNPNIGRAFLSDLVFYRTYAATKPNGRKETWDECVSRLESMHLAKFPKLAKGIKNAFDFVRRRVVLPSMRSLQFGGDAILRENLRGYNCSAVAIDCVEAIAELVYVLMCGTGVGFSVQGHHVAKLQAVPLGQFGEFWPVPDSREGWADSVKVLFKNPFVEFDYSQIRPAGERLSSGGTASGPDALMVAHNRMRHILLEAEGRKLKPVEVHDVCCVLADMVVVGGVRRAALVSLFSWTDQEMLDCKADTWWEDYPWRARANNSAVILRNELYAEHAFNQVMDACIRSNAGEPGIFWTNDYEQLSNPCMEISLRSAGLCNLTEVNVAACKSFTDFLHACEAAAFIGTLQASYTKFNYVRKIWSKNAKEEALLGVSLTGLAMAGFPVSPDELVLAALNGVRMTNRLVARWIGIKPGARLTTVKPSGTASAFLGTPSGIHAAHAKFYVRRVRVDKSHPVAEYLLDCHPEICENDAMSASNIVVSMPVVMPSAITRDEETALELLARMKVISDHWIEPGHINGPNRHNVSLTVSYKDHEVLKIRQWMWDNRESYAGISLLPYADSTYTQMPFEEISEQKFRQLTDVFPDIDLSQVSYVDIEDDRAQESACAGGACEWGVT